MGYSCDTGEDVLAEDFNRRGEKGGLTNSPATAKQHAVSANASGSDRSNTAVDRQNLAGHPGGSFRQ